jgi:DNA-binding Lrp family transcriptional regulator
MNDPDPTWQHVVPKLDDALASLNKTDRNAILFRFFEQRGLREVGEALGVSEEAAKKRVARALEKLRRILCRRGVDVSAAALITGLTYEASAVPAAFATNLIANTVAKIGTGEVTGLLAEVIAALHWAKVKLLVGGAAVALIAILAPVVMTRFTEREGPKVTRTVSATSNPSESSSLSAAREVVAQRGLQITVVDEMTGQGIVGAELTHTLMRWGDDASKPPTPIRTDAGGVAEVRLPTFIPDPIQHDSFQVFVRAAEYAPKYIRWLSTTGGVLRIVTNDYTLKLERGITLSGTVVEERSAVITEAIPFRGTRTAISRASPSFGWTKSIHTAAPQRRQVRTWS